MMPGSVFNTSSMRVAATFARGSKMAIADIIRKLAMITIAYVMNAIISPTCMTPKSICCAAVHTMSALVPFMMSVMPGNMNIIARLVKSCVRMRSPLARSNRSCAMSSRRKARTTCTPVRLSRDTRFTRSMSFCMIRNFGYVMPKSVATSPTSSAMASTIIQLIETFVVEIITMPPMARMGAYNTMRMSMMSTICTCVMSLVERVMRLAVEKRLSSVAPNETTFVNRRSRSDRAISAPARDAMRPTSTEQATMPSVTSSIKPPVVKR